MIRVITLFVLISLVYSQITCGLDSCGARQSTDMCTNTNNYRYQCALNADKLACIWTDTCPPVVVPDCTKDGACGTVIPSSDSCPGTTSPKYTCAINLDKVCKWLDNCPTSAVPDCGVDGACSVAIPSSDNCPGTTSLKYKCSLNANKVCQWTDTCPISTAPDCTKDGACTVAIPSTDMCAGTTSSKYKCALNADKLACIWTDTCPVPDCTKDGACATTRPSMDVCPNTVDSYKYKCTLNTNKVCQWTDTCPTTTVPDCTKDGACATTRPSMDICPNTVDSYKYKCTLNAIKACQWTDSCPTSTTPTCTTNDACAAVAKPTDYICPNTVDTPRYKCALVKDGTCGWAIQSCPTVVACDCSNAVKPPTQALYTCADGKIGGQIYCKTDTCTYGVTECTRYVARPGFCPVCDPAIMCIAAGQKTCSLDTDCKDATAKCCCDPCGGTSCKTPLTTKPGDCPDASTLGKEGVCGTPCDGDAGCTDSRKCCANSCGSKQCEFPKTATTPEPTTGTCTNTQCVGDPPAAPQICLDGKSVKGYICKPSTSTSSDGTSNIKPSCSWQFVDCPNVVIPTPEPGSCPILDNACVGTDTAPHECSSDSDCAIKDNRCCYNSCKRRVCIGSIPPDTCVTGDQNTVCLDKATADAAGSTATDTSIPTGDCYYRCLQNYHCTVAQSSSLCTRGDGFDACVDACKNPDTTPVTSDPCSHRTPCECLTDTDNECNWCQVNGYATDGVKTTSFVWGYCSPPSETNKCTAPTSTGGDRGTLCTFAPTECVDDASDPTIKDTSSEFIDQVCKEGFTKINTGEVGETKLQEVIESLCDGCITIVRVLAATASADNTGTVKTIVKADCPTKKPEEICTCINQAYSKSCNIPESNFKDCKLTEYSETDPTAKRTIAQTGSNNYLASATVDPSTTGNGSSALAPVWMMLFAIFLFFRM